MSEKQLIQAMRPGGVGPFSARKEHDLGRFGLGLKTASLSQCRRLTVVSKNKMTRHNIARWDLDFLRESNQWLVNRDLAKGSEQKIDASGIKKGGTIVLWEHLDRLVESADAANRGAHDHFLERVESLEKHLGMIFHRFMAEEGLKLFVNDNPVRSWNPFLPEEKARQALSAETIGAGVRKVVVQPFVLPHYSKLKGDYEAAAGPEGWSHQQGFYVYRNKRLLVPGGWLGLGFKREEQYMLARVQIDITNQADSYWEIDVKKSRARPPGSLKGRFETYRPNHADPGHRSVSLSRKTQGAKPSRSPLPGLAAH